MTTNEHIYRPQELIISLLPGLQIAHQAIGREIEQIKALLNGEVDPPSMKLKPKPRTDHMDDGGNTEFIVSQLRENGPMSPTQLSDIAARGNVGNLGHKANIGNALKRAMGTGHIVRVRDGVYELSEREKINAGLYQLEETPEVIEPKEPGLPAELGRTINGKQLSRVFAETQKGWLLSIMRHGLTLDLDTLKNFAAGDGTMGKLGEGNNMSVLLNHGVKDGLIKKFGGGNYAITTAGKKLLKEKTK